MTTANEKDGNGMKSMDDTRRRRGRAAGVGFAGVCALVAVTVPVAHDTQAASTNNSGGMVCEWGTLDGATRTYDLTATDGYTSEPDGNAIYDWSYTASGAFQLPGPVLCANTGETLVVNLTNHLATSTSIQFPGQTSVEASYDAFATSVPVGPVADQNGVLDSLVPTAAAGDSVSYRFPAGHEGTFQYRSGTDPQLQVQMGLFGALVIYPSGVTITGVDIQAIPVDGGTDNAGAGLTDGNLANNFAAEANCAYRSLEDPAKCDPLAIFERERENILILSEVDPGVHQYYEQQVQNGTGRYAWNDYPNGYAPHYYMINGRSMPDTIAPNFAPWLPAQPYGAMATVEPWSATQNPLDAYLRYVGVGVGGYDFHPHSNHEHVIAQDGALMKGAGSVDNTEEKFNILVGPGATLDATFRWTNEEGYADSDGNRVPVQWPQGPNMLEGDFWSGSPYLGNSGLLNPGIVTKTQCGEYYHVAHDHDLTHVTNYGITFGGMLTLIKVTPAGTSLSNSACND